MELTSVPALQVARPLPSANRVLLIVNAGASRVSDRRREGVLAALAGRHRVDAVSTRSAQEATDLCRSAAAGSHNLVIAFGGDGTVSAAARGLAGTGVPLAPLPGGYTNVFARTLGVPRDPVAAADRIASLPRRHALRQVALGAVDGRPFLFAAGAGFSAALMQRLDAAGGLKSGFGSVYAAWQVTALAARAMAGDAPKLTIDAGGREVDAIAAIVQNSDPLTYFGPRPIRICPTVGLGPSGISVAALRSARLRDVTRLAAGALAGGIDSLQSHPRMEHWPTIREARITTADPGGIAVEADGDYLGCRRSVELGVARSKLLLLT